MIDLRIPCSPEQLEVIADHALAGKDLGVLPDERAWMLGQARKIHPTARIIKAELDIENGQWLLKIDRRAEPKPKIVPVLSE